ncbi:zinc finger CCCH domain-containing protein 14-like [Sesamum indicum]|uniref:Zinc finger CCCH domain-containing protein 14-like n=1 Tax=Sesamum indicum TaxID=4182 RepID=A0A6I9TDT2_SESIN|nr:zinc finger CCCH domain-containing protein 14-like [Sesamum indicum]
MDTRKRGRGEFANGGAKKSKSEIDSFSSGIGSKSKPCTKFFSTAGCPFGENCHFLHYVPGGYNAVAQMMNLAPAPAPTSRMLTGPLAVQNGSSAAAVKTKICNKYKTAEGCKFGDKCHFAHGEWELGKPIAPSHEDPHSMGAIPNRFGGRPEAPIPGPAASFGASATAKISVDASLAGAVIGKGGVNSKQICRQTGAKLAIRDHESDPNLRNIELEGSFEQIQQASAMVRELIVSVGSAAGPGKPMGATGGPPAPGSNFKTKLCENFSKGSCTFGDRCHFAHGAAELRKSGI